MTVINYRRTANIAFSRRKYYSVCFVLVMLLIFVCDYDYYKDHFKRIFVYSKDGEWCPRCSPEIFLESQLFESVDKVLINKPKVCSEKSLGLILVPTAANNTARREVVRKTWYPLAKKAGFDILFAIGQTSNQHAILAEDDIYHDIVQWPVDDGWRRLLVKTVAMLYWFEKHCETKWLIKADDDAVLNIPLLVDLLNTEKRTRIIMGRVNQYKPHCLVWWKMKYCIPAEEHWKLRPYPRFTAGGTYILTKESVSLLVEKYQKEKNSLHLVFMEDLFLGFLSRKAGVEVVSHPSFEYCDQIYERDFLTRIHKMIAVFDCKPIQYQAIWKMVS